MKKSLKNINKNKITKSPKEDSTSGVQFSQEQLEATLLDCFDLMGRALLDSLFLVLGDTARCLKEDKLLEGNGIDIGIEDRYVDNALLGIVKEYTNATVTDKGFVYDFNGVPVRCKFIKRKYDCLVYPDVKFYGPEQYRIPNQFSVYWRIRSLIK